MKLKDVRIKATLVESGERCSHGQKFYKEIVLDKNTLHPLVQATKIDLKWIEKGKSNVQLIVEGKVEINMVGNTINPAELQNRIIKLPYTEEEIKRAASLSPSLIKGEDLD